ncbi:kappaPI-actitoxin-Avd3a-like [Drosophila teissieri]|uniref:kappaPI-actitoxin-Avd3a-like n=1 Tax=Drosophila teissieri TaxID=7243 RepID=UPI001CBA2B2E|nr:kappaPI-actitoxin-Avd3a-like [Drosophila teissieri]
MKMLILLFVFIALASHSMALKNEICELPRDPGPCRAFIERWTYDSRTKECKYFIYGGCGGNANNFYFKEQCIDKCVE